MSQLPVVPLTPQQQRQFSARLYSLLGRQVKSYHKHYRMGDNSSVPDGIAEELIRSVRYTLDINGGYDPQQDLEAQLQAGQAILEERLEQARQLAKLVSATAPSFQSQCHWEAIQTLDHYLTGYDHLHFAHQIPEDWDYPLLRPVPDRAEGIDHALYLLNCLWLENQILHSFPVDSIDTLISYYPPDYWEAPQNLCEQPLWNALGKVLLGEPPAPLPFSDDHLQRLTNLLRSLPTDFRKSFLEQGMAVLSAKLGFTPAMARYALNALGQLLPRLQAPLDRGDLSCFFL